MTQKITDHKRIFEWLADGEWHCGTELSYMKDDRKRISELRQKGYLIEGIPCDGRCGVRHHSRLYMRRLVAQNPTTGKIERKMMGISGGSEKELEKQIEFHEKHIKPLFVHSSIFDL